MSAEEAIAVVRRNTEEVQGQGNFEVFEELFAPDFVDHILVVDDCSSDETTAIVEARKEARTIALRTPKNLGVGGATMRRVTEKSGSGTEASRSPRTFRFRWRWVTPSWGPGSPRRPEVPYEDATSTERRLLLSNGSPPFRGHSITEGPNPPDPGRRPW